ncbi:MAG: MFS transporter [Candidatus Methylopumilus sp.]|nr:MFS transporter [Candidatus Methylopumilus sp.]
MLEQTVKHQAHPSANPLRNLNFFKLLSYRVCMVFSYQIMAVVVGWHLYSLTHDPLALGLVGLAEIIPYFCSALFAGYAVDHYSKRNFAILSSLVLMLSSLTLAAVASEMITKYPTLVIYASIGLVGLGRAFIAPSYSSIFAIILPRKEYGKASGIGSSAFQIGLVTGPALGGVLVGWTSVTIAYLVAASFALMSALPLVMLNISHQTTKPEKAVFAGIAEAVKFVVNHQVILSAQALDMFAVLLGGAVAMLPAFIHDIYQVGPEGLGILRSSPAIGAIMTGIYLARNPIREHAGKYLLWAVAGFGVCIIGFGLTSHFWVAALILVLSGIFDGVSVILRTTIMQLSTPDHMRGRVASINGIFIGSSNELGAFESGVTAKLFGLVPSVVLGGLMTLGVVATTAKLTPKLRNLDLNHLE